MISHPDIKETKADYHRVESCASCKHYWGTLRAYVDGWCSMHAENGRMAAVNANGKCNDYEKECIHKWHADQDNDCNTCIKCGARQEIYTE